MKGDALSMPYLNENGGLVCECGNEDYLEGFFTCDSEGNEVEPTEADWPVPLYKCDRCGAIINIDELPKI